MLTYAIVTPARNERDNLLRLAESILNQTHRPAHWVIVDDGSDDGMEEVADELVRRHGWILVRGHRRGPRTTSPRAGGAAATCSRSGAASVRLPGPVDVFVKVDADTSFDAGLLRAADRALRRASRDLGIGGGSCWEERDGAWERDQGLRLAPARRLARLPLGPATTTSSRWSRRWAGTASTRCMAELRGYRTEGFQDIGFRHHRKVGEREGRTARGIGPGPPGLAHGLPPDATWCCARSTAPREDIASVAMVWGYAAAAATGAPRCSHPTVISRVRDRQRLRIVIRRGGWS